MGQKTLQFKRFQTQCEKTLSKPVNRHYCHYDCLGLRLRYHYYYYYPCYYDYHPFLTNPDPSEFLNWGTTMKTRLFFARFVLFQPSSSSCFFRCYYSYSYHCIVILVFLFNNLSFLTFKFLFRLYVFFFT